MTLTVAAVSDSSVLRVQLTVASTTGGALPTPEGSAVVFYRIHEDGTRWRVLTGATPRIVGGAYIDFDYHAPFNVPVTYVVQAGGNESAPSGEAWVISDSPWLISSSVPELSFAPAFVDDLGDESLPWNGQLVEVAQSAYVVPRSFGYRGAGTSSLRVGVEPADVAALKALVADSSQLLLNFPPQPGWDVPWVWVQPLDITKSNPGKNDNAGGAAAYPYRMFNIPYAVVDVPDLDVTPVWTDGDLVAAYPTDALALAAFPHDYGRTFNVPGA